MSLKKVTISLKREVMSLKEVTMSLKKIRWLWRSKLSKRKPCGSGRRVAFWEVWYTTTEEGLWWERTQGHIHCVGILISDFQDHTAVFFSLPSPPSSPGGSFRFLSPTQEWFQSPQMLHKQFPNPHPHLFWSYTCCLTPTNTCLEVRYHCTSQAVLGLPVLRL